MRAARAKSSTRTFGEGLITAIALLAGGVVSLIVAPAVLAATLSVNFGPSGSAISCDALDTCSGSLTGNLTGQSGTYAFQFTLDAPSDISGAQACFTPASGGTNQATINFADPMIRGQLVLSTGQICLPTDLSMESGTISIPFIIVSGTGDYVGAAGSGSLGGAFSGSVLGGSSLTISSLSSTDFIVSGGGSSGGTGGSGGGPNPGATPELDSLTLFGSALAGIGGYLGLRHRARRTR